MTTLTADICPRCGAPVTTKSTGGVCLYCGAQLRSSRGVDPTSAPPVSESDDERIVKLIELGKIASEAGRVDESLGYFNRVLEVRPDVALAWLWKGLLLVETWRLEKPTLRAVVSCFEQAVTNAQDAERENILRLCTKSAIDFGSRLWDGMKPVLGQPRGPLDSAAAGRLIGEIGDALSFGVRHHNGDEQQLRTVLAVLGDVSRHPVRKQLHPVTVEALAQLHKSAADHLRARGRDA